MHDFGNYVHVCARIIMKINVLIYRYTDSLSLKLYAHQDYQAPPQQTAVQDTQPSKTFCDEEEQQQERVHDVPCTHTHVIAKSVHSY